MAHSVKLSWKEQMTFEGEVNGHKIILDADETVGGRNLGPRPKPLMLMALAGCTAMDVVSILKKMRIDVADFDVRVDGDLSDEHPKYYKNMHIVYEFWGKDLQLEKLQKAVDLSQERYCGVSALYKHVIPVTSEIVLHEQE